MKKILDMMKNYGLVGIGFIGACSNVSANSTSVAAPEIFPAVWPVSGLYAAHDTKDLGKITGNQRLSDIKVRGWIDAHYVNNFNRPNRNTVDANQSLSVIKGRNVSIEGRTFDIHNNSFTLSLAEIELEKTAEYGGVGAKLDLAFGDTTDIIVDSIRGSLTETGAADPVSSFDKPIQHASVTYIVPMGNGIRMDLGKFETHIGAEAIPTIKNWNYSHSYSFTYAIPFQELGLHLNYAWNDNFYTDFYVLNGWNATVDNNSAKTIGPTIGWTPQPWLSLMANYLIGPEQFGNNSNLRQLIDAQLLLGPFEDWSFLFNYDQGFEKNALASNKVNARWNGLTGYVRYKVNNCFEPSFRVEYYRDRSGFTTNVPQKIMSYTLTFNTRVGDTGNNTGSALMIRPEIRYDKSTAKFFSKKTEFRSKKNQLTLGAGVTWFF